MMEKWQDKFNIQNQYYKTERGILYNRDIIETLQEMPDNSIDTIITSPPYWLLRNYGVEGQIGLEKTIAEYINNLLKVTLELYRVLKPTGILFWNHGNSYGKNNSRKNSGIIPKSLTLQNYRLILRMVDEQKWILRNIIIWEKTNHIPESVRDRFTNAYEPVFMLTKNQKYWFDLDGVRKPRQSTQTIFEPYSNKNKGVEEIPSNVFVWKDYTVELLGPLGKNPGDIWKIATQSFSGAHFAIFPEALVKPLIIVGCPPLICTKCGKLRVRIIEQGNFIKTGGTRKKGYSGFSKKQKTKRIGYYEREAKGWSDCKCKAPWVAGITLDPFMGSGTTAVVSEKLKRNWIGIELNKSYCEIAKKRIYECIKQDKLFV